MDPEQTFLRVHARVSGMLSQLLTPRIRTVLEYVYLVVAVVLFSVLVVMHTNFVQQPGCSSQLSGVEITEAQLVRIKITSAGLWSPVAYDDGVMLDEKQEILPANFKVPNDNDDNFAFTAANLLSTWINTGSKRSKLNFKSWRGEKEILEHQIEMAVGSTNTMTSAVPDEMENKDDRGAPKIGTRQIGFMSRESLKMTVVHIFRKWSSRFSSFWGSLNQFFASASKLWNIAGLEMIANIPRFLRALQLDHVTAFTVQLLEKSSRAHDPTFLYTTEKGYFLLPEDAKSQHHIRTANVSISADNTCFGNRWQRILINKLIGYDTILTNSLLSSPGPGYLYNFQTKEFYDLSHGPESADAIAQFGGESACDLIQLLEESPNYFVTKCSVLLMSLFVFFTTTMSVSFTLRETQSRMLKFTVQLQHHARHHLPTFQLIFVHVIESLVFVPIMIGILFFLFEFYDDQLLAFLVLILVWLCELFTMISVRTPLSMQFFPRFFLLYFLVFHIYFFSYAHGFSYLAFSTTAAFMQHLILFFWNRYEVPALQRFMRNRAQLQQQTGVHITSSTILTSTLHIARVNMRNPNLTHNELGVIPEPRLEHEQVQSVDNSGPQPTVGIPDSTGLAESNPQQTETAPASNSLNPFGSFLLSILGGASTDGVVSLLSLFRDLRDQHNVYVEPTPDGNEAAT